MSIKLSWKKLSQVTATTFLGIAMLTASGTSKANAVSLQQFKISGTLSRAFEDPFNPISPSLISSFDGVYTVDVDQLPTTTSVALEDWSINIRDSLGNIQTQISPFPFVNGRPGGNANVSPERLQFNYLG